MGEAAAKTAMREAKLTLGDVTELNSNTVATGNVISQGPAGGSSAAEGSPVTLVISSGPRMVAVPKVVGLTQSAATIVITGAKLTLGTVTQQNCNTVDAGNVRRQYPTSRTDVC